jgi:signal transduction histidine kinase
MSFLAADSPRLRGPDDGATQHLASLEETNRLLASAVLAPREVAALLVRHAVDATGARAGLLGLVSDDGREVRLLESHGYPIDTVEEFRRFPVAADFPLADAIRAGRPILLADRATRGQAYPHLEEVVNQTGGGALAALPLVVDGKTVGALGIVFPGPRRFDEEERHFLLALAGSAALALERSRLAEAQRRALAELEETTRRLEALQAVTDVALGHLDLDPLLGALLERVVRVLGADAGKVLLAGEDGVLAVRASRGLDEALLRDVRVPPGEGVAGRIAASRRAMIVEDPAGDLLSPALRRRGIRSLAGAPLLAGARLLGALHVGKTAAHGFREEDLVLLRVVAERAAVAVERAELYEAARAAASLNARLYEESQRALLARDDLLAIVSHDLRNPLGSIVLNASVLERLLPAGTCDAARRQLKMVQRSAERMNRLVGSLLDAESFEAGAFRLELGPVPAARLIEEAVEGMADLAEARGVELRAAPAPGVGEVRCDRERVLQVFSNLLGNAIRFSPAGAAVDVGGARDGDEVRFRVRDRGPGIAPEHRERIFERHFQGRRGPGSGLGLGLYIAHGIVVSHGGRIWCEAAEGGGTTFVFTLPVEGLGAG